MLKLVLNQITVLRSIHIFYIKLFFTN
jgi:hypothetical protein